MDVATDQEKYLLMRRRLQSKNMSLVNLSVSVVLQHRDLMFNTQNGRFNACNLDKSAREKLLSVLETEFYSLHRVGDNEIFKRRLHVFEMLWDGVEKIDLSALISFCVKSPKSAFESHIAKILRCIAEKSPNVTSLTMNTNTRRADCFATPEIIEALGKLEKLTKFEAKGLEIYLHDLRALCSNGLKKLEHLEVQSVIYRDSDLEDTADFKESFANLRVIVFKGEQNEIDGRRSSVFMSVTDFLRHCRLHLTKLNVLGHFIDENYYGLFSHTLPDVDELPREPSELLHLHMKSSNRGYHRAFPNVTNLNIDWKSYKNKAPIDDLLEFPKVECLSLDAPNKKILNKFLAVYGAKLHTLAFTLESRNMDNIKVKFKTIFDYCPNLEALALSERISVVDSAKPLNRVTKLKSFSRTMDYVWVEPITNLFLSNIFVASPNLEKFSLMCTLDQIFFDLDDINLVSRQIAEGKILAKLTTFEFEHCTLFNLKPKRLKSELGQKFYAWNGLIKNACAYLPNLSNVKFKWNLQELEAPLKRCNICHEEAFMNSIGDKWLFKFLRAYNCKICHHKK